MRQKPQKFSTKEEALQHVDSVTRVKLEDYLKNSKILSRKNLFDFL